LLLALNSPELDVRRFPSPTANTVVENAYRNAVEIIRKSNTRWGTAASARAGR